jgi:hypothetical protein
VKGGRTTEHPVCHLRFLLSGNEKRGVRGENRRCDIATREM